MDNSFLGWLVVVAATAVGVGVIGLIAWGIHWFYRQGIERPAWVDGVWNTIMRWSLIVTGGLILLLVAGIMVWPAPPALIGESLLIGAALSATGLVLFLCGLSLIAVEQRHPWMKTSRGSPSFLAFLFCFMGLFLLGVFATYTPDNLRRLAMLTGVALGVSAVLGLHWLIRRTTDTPVLYPPALAPRQPPRPGGSGDLRAPSHARQAAMTRRTRARKRTTAF